MTIEVAVDVQTNSFNSTSENEEISMSKIKEIISGDDMVSVVLKTCGSSLTYRLDYLSRVPQSVPSGKIIAHNCVRPTRRLGSRGFRAWFAEPSSKYEVCPCKWVPELGFHYRVAAASNFLS